MLRSRLQGGQAAGRIGQRRTACGCLVHTGGVSGQPGLQLSCALLQLGDRGTQLSGSRVPGCTAQGFRRTGQRICGLLAGVVGGLRRLIILLRCPSPARRAAAIRAFRASGSPLWAAAVLSAMVWGQRSGVL